MNDQCIEDKETIREFLVESHENLSRLDQDLVELESRPHDAALLSSVFRTIHTIKGACGFLAFSNLEGITHRAESLLSQLRDGKRSLTPTLVSLILETVDATRQILATIEIDGKEGPDNFQELLLRLQTAAEADLDPGPQSLKPPPESRPVNDAPSALNSPQQPQAPPLSGASISMKQSETPVQIKEVGTQDGADARKETRRAFEGPELRSQAVDSNIRVTVGLLDKLMDLVGELVLTRNQILQMNTEREDAALAATSQRLDLITTELQEGVMKTRMQPIGVVWNKLPRVVRDMAISLDKEIQLVMEGTETELDKTIIEAISDPLIHLVRNACDHGIESPDARVRSGKSAQGKLGLRAYHEGGQVNIEISDDGAGIDVARLKQKAIENGLVRQETADKMTEREALALIFLPGLSTAQKVTNLSGRGVGMDVVKSHIEKIGGVVDLVSRPGDGTTVKIRIPLTLAIIPGLLVTSCGERFVVPQISLLELIRLEGDTSSTHIEDVGGTPVYRRRGTLLPVVYLNRILGMQSAAKDDAVNMVVLTAENHQFGLIVDGINDTQEIVVKPMGKQFKGLPLYAGATIMGDGRVALILDVLGIGQTSGVFGESREIARDSKSQKAAAEKEKQRLLLFRAGSFDRLAIPLSLVSRLEEFPRSLIEKAGGGHVVQYRDQLLPLVPLSSVLEPDPSHPHTFSDPVQVIVFSDGTRSLGMIVDQILDVAEEAVSIRLKSSRKGILGSAVVASHVTDFLDLNEVIQAVRDSWQSDSTCIPREGTVLLTEVSPLSRGIVRSWLEMAGYSVLEAANLDEATATLERHRVNVVLASLDLPSAGAINLLSAIHDNAQWKSIPVLALTTAPTQLQDTAARQAGFQLCCGMFDSASLLEGVARTMSVHIAALQHEQECLV